MRCDACGHTNSPDANFCSSCGSRLSGDDETTVVHAIDIDSFEEAAGHPAAPEEAAATGELLVRRGPSAGSRFALNPEVTRIGRHPASDIFLDDITVSRRHAEIIRRHDHFSVRDVGSLNGTYLNRERIEEADLANGDEVQIGKFRLIFLVGPKDES
jgi:hypothetical protein